MSILNKRKNIFKERETDQLLNGWINKRIGQTFLKAIGFDLKRKIGTLTDEELEMIQNKSHSWDFSIISDNGFKNAQVMSGGISTDEIDPSSMESKIVKGIYFAGETCNVEGKSGGYNLHWAWISGMTAGESAQKSLI